MHLPSTTTSFKANNTAIFNQTGPVPDSSGCKTLDYAPRQRPAIPFNQNTAICRAGQMRKPALDFRIFKPDFMLETNFLQCIDPVNAKRLTIFIQRDLEIEA